MKSTRYITLAVFVAMSLAACSNENTENSEAESNPADSPAYELLALHNEVRAVGTRCADDKLGSSADLQWNKTLAEVAQRHSQDMADNNHFSHTGTDDSSTKNRVEDAGYTWSRFGENLSYGQDTPQAAVDGWLTSEYHCKNIMHPEFTEMGASRVGKYWTVVFGKPL